MATVPTQVRIDENLKKQASELLHSWEWICPGQ